MLKDIHKVPIPSDINASRAERYDPNITRSAFTLITSAWVYNKYVSQ